MGTRRCAFLDRDGVINSSPEPGDYIRSWRQFHLNRPVVEWIRLFNALDVLVIVVTNQRGVSLGLIDPRELEEIHRNMCDALLKLGARIDDVFYCPHAKDSCGCRKPLPGLVEQSARKWNIDVRKSIMLGDSLSDRKLAETCGMQFIEISNGHIAPKD